jgi:hypothetical protein
VDQVDLKWRLWLPSDLVLGPVVEMDAAQRPVAAAHLDGLEFGED